MLFQSALFCIQRPESQTRKIRSVFIYEIGYIKIVSFVLYCKNCASPRPIKLIYLPISSTRL